MDEEGFPRGNAHFPTVHVGHLCDTKFGMKGCSFLSIFARIRSSFRSLENLRVLTVVAMFTAIQVVLVVAFDSLVSASLMITIDFVMVVASGMLYGPVVAGLQAAVVDILTALLFPKGAFFPGFTLSSLLGGMVYGFVLYKRPWTWQRLLLSKAIVNVCINIGLNTFWLSLILGKAIQVLIWPRLTKNLVLLPVEVLLMVGVAQILRRLAPRIPGYQNQVNS